MGTVSIFTASVKETPYLIFLFKQKK